MLKDPTEHLRLLCDHLDDSDASRRWHQLHMHIAAGGALPAQWRGEGTAVRALMSDAQGNALLLASFERQRGQGDGSQYVRTTADAIGRVTGED